MPYCRRPIAYRLLPQSSRRTAARSKGGGIEADRQAFWQAFPNLACFAPSISKECFGGFVGFQGVASPKNLNDVPPNFFVAPASLQPYSRRLRAVFRRPGPHGFDRVQRFALFYGFDRLSTRSWRRSDPDRENFEPNRYSGLRKEISVILPRAFGFRQPEVVGPPRTTDAGARVTGRDTRVLPFRAASGLAGGEIRKLRIMPRKLERACHIWKSYSKHLITHNL